MQCPAPVEQALQRLNLGIELPNDEKLVSAWLDWFLAQEMTTEDKWLTEPPAKRRKSLEDASQPCIAK